MVHAHDIGSLVSWLVFCNFSLPDGPKVSRVAKVTWTLCRSAKALGLYLNSHFCDNKSYCLSISFVAIFITFIDMTLTRIIDLRNDPDYVITLCVTANFIINISLMSIIAFTSPAWYHLYWLLLLGDLGWNLHFGGAWTVLRNIFTRRKPSSGLP